MMFGGLSWAKSEKEIEKVPRMKVKNINRAEIMVCDSLFLEGYSIQLSNNELISRQLTRNLTSSHNPKLTTNNPQPRTTPTPINEIFTYFSRQTNDRNNLIIWSPQILENNQAILSCHCNILPTVRIQVCNRKVKP